MNVFVFFAIVFVFGHVASYENSTVHDWELFKVRYNKHYASPEENRFRMRIFVMKRRYIMWHNTRYLRGVESYQMHINHLTDLTAEEINNLYAGLKVGHLEKDVYRSSDRMFYPSDDAVFLNSINWVKRGAVTPVHDQGDCGSCYAFSAVGAIESRNFIKNNVLLNVSVQEVIDCSQPYGNFGCRGGLMERVYNFVKGNKGLEDEKSYPYIGEDDDCRSDPKKFVVTINGYKVVSSGSEEDLKAAVTSGPVSIGLDASLTSFHHYGGGIYSSPECSSENINHGLLLVGYGTDQATKKDYWLIKNSWGEDWGENGYLRLAKNDNNMCGVATDASFPVI